MDAGDIKNHEGDGRRGYSARTCVVVAKVENGAELLKRYSRKVGSSPMLGKVGIQYSCKIMEVGLGYL